MILILIILIIFNCYPDSSIDISGIIGSEVIINPYENINYDEPQVYNINIGYATEPYAIDDYDYYYEYADNDQTPIEYCQPLIPTPLFPLFQW